MSTVTTPVMMTGQDAKPIVTMTTPLRVVSQDARAGQATEKQSTGHDGSPGYVKPTSRMALRALLAAARSRIADLRGALKAARTALGPSPDHPHAGARNLGISAVSIENKSGQLFHPEGGE